MRRYFLDLRVYRRKDHQYLDVLIDFAAKDLSAIESAVNAFESGLKVAGAEIIGLEHIHFDYPKGSKGQEQYHTFESPETITALYKFLQIRDRRIKKESYTTEDNGNGTAKEGA